MSSEKQEDLPSQDSILAANCQIYTKQMDLIWGMMKHISYVGVGTMVAWFFLLQKNPLYSALLIIFSSIIMFLFLLIIRRQIYLQLQYGDKILPTLKPARRKPDGEVNSTTFQTAYDDDRKLNAAMLARSIPSVLLLGNFILLIISSIEMIQKNQLTGLFLLASCAVTFLFFSFNFKKSLDLFLFS